MARIRSVKPEMRRSLTVSSWPIPVRWTFVGLLGYLDDEGRALDDLRLVKAELYPLDDAVTTRRVDQHLGTLAEQGPLCRYEVAGQRYLHVTSWHEHQRINRPSPSKIPPCPFHEKDVSPHGALTEDSLNPHGGLTPSRAREEGKGKEQGREGKGSSSTGSQSPNGRSANGHSDGPARQPDFAAIQRKLGCDLSHARRVSTDVLARASTQVTTPTAYVLNAIDAEPKRYHPTPTPPRVDRLCDHSRDRATCPHCALDQP